MSHEFNDFHRGEIYFADLNPVYGHEQGGVRRCWFSRTMWEIILALRSS